jgi:hypothetical protein
MSHPRYFGYQKQLDDCVLITIGCRPVGRVQGEEQVRAFVAELDEGDTQQVLARWSELTAIAPH